MEEGVGGVCSGTAGTELDDVIEGGVGEAVEEGLAEAEPVSIVAGAAARTEEDGVDGTDCRGVGGDFSEQGKDGLLAGVGDVEAGEVGEFGEFEERWEVFGEEAELVEVDELVVAGDAMGGGFGHMHGWGAGGLDAGTDEAEEEAGEGGLRGHGTRVQQRRCPELAKVLPDGHDSRCAQQEADSAGGKNQSAALEGIVGQAFERETGGGVGGSFGFRLDGGEHVADLVGEKGMFGRCESVRHGVLQ